MTKKQETINAMIETAKRYEGPGGHGFFSTLHCPLCRIHNKFMEREMRVCVGCPLADMKGNRGCVGFQSYKNASEITPNPYPEGRAPTEEFLDRAATLRKHAEIIKTWPEERFTVKGWIYSGKELSRDD